MALRPLIAAALAALIVTAAAAPAAQGKTYRVFACKTPDGVPLPLDPKLWRGGNYQAWSDASNSCSSGGWLALYMGNPGGGDMYGGGVANWVFDFPGGGLLRGVSLRRTVATSPGGDFSATPQYIAFARAGAGGVTPLETCEAPGCTKAHPSLGDHPANEVSFSFSDYTAGLEFLVHCGGSGSCGRSQGAPRIALNVHRMEFVVDDLNAPTATNLVGTLRAAGQQGGHRTLGASVADYQSGLYEVVARVDGKEVDRVRPDTNGGRCVDAGFRDEPDFRAFNPCSTNSKPVNVSIDTTKFADGRHEVSVTAYDAAQNPHEYFKEEITFENVPAPAVQGRPAITGQLAEPRPGDTLKAEPGKWSGAGLAYAYQWQASADGAAWGDVSNGSKASYLVDRGDIGKKLRVVVTASNGEGSATSASEPTGEVKSGATVVPSGAPGPPVPSSEPNGGDPSTAQLVVDREQRTVEVNHGAKIVITGRLVDAENQPIPNASVDVFEQLVLTAAPWSKVGTVMTDSQGGYVYRPKTTGSRRLRFAFADKRDAANYRATREVLVSVKAGMSISAKRKVVKPRGLIKLRGRVSIDALPKTGTWVEVQVLDAGSWRAVATRKTSSKGLWTFKHRLRQSAGVSFKFRSRLRVVGDVASAESTSASLKVRVR